MLRGCKVEVSLRQHIRQFQGYLFLPLPDLTPVHPELLRVCVLGRCPGVGRRCLFSGLRVRSLLTVRHVGTWIESPVADEVLDVAPCQDPTVNHGGPKST